MSTQMSASSRPVLRPGQAPLGLGVLISTFIFFLCIIGFVQLFLMSHIDNATALTRISAVLQDLFVFMLPALLTAMLVTKLPASLLQIDRRPGLSFLGVTMVTAVLSIPVMNVIIQWNADLELPASMSDFARWARGLEEAAAQGVQLMMGDSSAGSMMLSIAIIGVLAPVCEELFFRGAMQRLLLAMRLNSHVAIWITALLFSAFHMQFYGFVPRLLLGAFFGYAAYWSGSLWTSVVAHTLNNTLAVISMYVMTGGSALDTLGTDGSLTSWIFVFVSLALTSMGVAWMSCHRPAARNDVKRPAQG